VVARAAKKAARAAALDAVSLAKPRLLVLVVATSATGRALATREPSWRGLAVIVATALLVAAANALNCWWERDIDARMQRTVGRPLVTGRFAPASVLAAGCALGAGSVLGLTLAGGPLVGALGTLACVTYVGIYTPLKRRSAWALPVGAAAGAIPPAMGWVSATGSLDQPAVVLFALLFFWQLPHFAAASLFLRQDYARAGLRVLSLAGGDSAALLTMAIAGALLVPLPLCLAELGCVSRAAATMACLLGAALVFLGVGVSLARGAARDAWARRYFGATLLYLLAVLLLLLLGRP
jgi:heme o synthase